MSIIKVRELYTQYGDVIIHNGISFDVKKGEIFGILGGSGSGKSTLLKNMLFLEKPTSGKIEFFGENIWALPEDKRGRILNRCGVMFQFGALFSSMNVLDNVAFLLTQKSHYDTLTINRISKMWLELVGLSKEVAYKYPYELSGGMKKRVGLARALALDPEILLLDEPSMGLSPLMTQQVFDVLAELKAGGMTILLVEQNAYEALTISDRAYIMESGNITLEGRSSELIDDPRVKDAYLGGDL